MIIDPVGAGATPRLVQSDDPSCDTLMVKFSFNVRPVIANVATLCVQVTDIETLACATLADTSALANRLLANANRLMVKPRIGYSSFLSDYLYFLAGCRLVLAKIGEVLATRTIVASCLIVVAILKAFDVVCGGPMKIIGTLRLGC